MIFLGPLWLCTTQAHEPYPNLFRAGYYYFSRCYSFVSGQGFLERIYSFVMTHSVTLTFGMDPTVCQSSSETHRRHPDLCFEDATVAISTESVFFLVHHGLLSRHSVFFASLDISSSKEPKALLDGRPAINLSDAPDDMFYFLRAIYDGL